MTINLVVNEYVSPGHGEVHVTSFEYENERGEKIETVQIFATGGYITLTYDQWKTMLALGMSMAMQDGN